MPATYSEVADALQATSVELLGKRTRSQPGWFAANETELRALIDARNTAHHAYNQHPSGSTRTRLTAARSKLQSVERRCKSDYIVGKCKLINDGIRGTGGKTAWDTIKLLKNGGLAPARRQAAVKMKKSDGSRADSAEENATVFADHFETLYGRTPVFKWEVLDTISLQPTATGLDHLPSDIEVRSALAKLNNTSPGDRVWSTGRSVEGAWGDGGDVQFATLDCALLLGDRGGATGRAQPSGRRAC